MLTPLKRHRSGVYCISFKGCSGQGHVPPPLSPLNGKNLGRAWNHSWDLHWRVSLNHDGWLTSRLQKLILFSQLFRFGSIPTSYALGWRAPAAPPSCRSSRTAGTAPCFQADGRNSTPLLPATQRATSVPTWRTGWKHLSLSFESSKFLSPYFFQIFSTVFSCKSLVYNKAVLSKALWTQFLWKL